MMYVVVLISCRCLKVQPPEANVPLPIPGCQRAPTGEEGDRVHSARRAGEPEGLPLVGNVPEAHRAIPARRGQSGSIRRKRQPSDHPSMPFERVPLSPGDALLPYRSALLQDQQSLIPSDGQQPGVWDDVTKAWGEGQSKARLWQDERRRYFRPGTRRVHMHAFIPARYGQQITVRGEEHRGRIMEAAQRLLQAPCRGIQDTDAILIRRMISNRAKTACDPLPIGRVTEAVAAYLPDILCGWAWRLPVILTCG